MLVAAEAAAAGSSSNRHREAGLLLLSLHEPHEQMHAPPFLIRRGQESALGQVRLLGPASGRPQRCWHPRMSPGRAGAGAGSSGIGLNFLTQVGSHWQNPSARLAAASRRTV